MSIVSFLVLSLCRHQVKPSSDLNDIAGGRVYMSMVYSNHMSKHNSAPLKHLGCIDMRD